MRHLAVQALTREGFAAFGDVVQLDGARQHVINDGQAIRYHDLARIDVSADGGYPLVNVFRTKPCTLPFAITRLESHPLGSQLFMPLQQMPFLVVVAPAGELDPGTMRAFVTCGLQGVNYARGVWHHPLLALEQMSDFLVIDRGGVGDNLIEQDLPEPLWITQSDIATCALDEPE
jgi:ureidoglycolate lyase